MHLGGLGKDEQGKKGTRHDLRLSHACDCFDRFCDKRSGRRILKFGRLSSFQLGFTGSRAHSLSERKIPTESSACAAAFSLPMLPTNPCGIPIHTSSLASTPTPTARSRYRRESSNSTSSSPT